MAGIIRIVSGIAIGGAGFEQIGAHPAQGVCALFLAGFLIMVGLDMELSDHPRRESGIDGFFAEGGVAHGNFPPMRIGDQHGLKTAKTGKNRRELIKRLNVQSPEI